MRIHIVFLSLIAALATAMAEPAPPLATPAAVDSAGREAALDDLLSERESIAAHQATIAAARKAGISEQTILEARFLYHVDRREDEAIAALLPEFLKKRDDFKLEDSAIFGVKEDWLAVVEYVQSIASLQKGDKDAFKRHITEAFWLSPRQAAAFAPHIERLRLEAAMRSVKIDFKSILAPLADGPPIALEKLIEEKKAMLLHFWAAQSQECEAAMPDFIKTATALSSNGIAVVSLVPPGSAENMASARKMVAPYADKPCGTWLVDAVEKPLSRDLRIQNLPNMVIVSPDGAVLFNGDPTDDAFWDAVKKIDARIIRPKAASDDDE
jgi:hypothetical protein